MENYTLTGNTDNTILKVEMNVTDDFQDYFKDKFPKALYKVKSLAEMLDYLKLKISGRKKVTKKAHIA